jgi:hypothetical protein
MPGRDKGLSYAEAAHAMQSGVAMELQLNIKDAIKDLPPGELSDMALKAWHDGAHKHLRVGVNSAMVEHGALAELLVSKGIIGHEEYVESLRLMMNEEVCRYEDDLQKRLGGTTKISLH